MALYLTSELCLDYDAFLSRWLSTWDETGGLTVLQMLSLRPPVMPSAWWGAFSIDKVHTILDNHIEIPGPRAAQEGHGLALHWVLLRRVRWLEERRGLDRPKLELKWRREHLFEIFGQCRNFPFPAVKISFLHFASARQTCLRQFCSLATKNKLFQKKMVASLWLCLLLTLDLGCATLSKSDRKKKPKEKAAPEKLPVVKEPGSTLTALDVLENYSNYKTDTSEKNFAGDVLGYVTPWNSHGYSRMDTSPMLMSPTFTNPIVSTSIHHQNHQPHCIHIFSCPEQLNRWPCH